MKRTALVLAFALCLSAAQPVHGRADGYSGHDWLAMTERDKLFHVLASIVFLDRYRITFQKSPQTYVRLMDAMLEHDTRLREKDVFQVFFQMLCAHDPLFLGNLGRLRQAVLSERISSGKIG